MPSSIADLNISLHVHSQVTWEDFWKLTLLNNIIMPCDIVPWEHLTLHLFCRVHLSIWIIHFTDFSPKKSCSTKGEEFWILDWRRWWWCGEGDAHRNGVTERAASSSHLSTSAWPTPAIQTSRFKRVLLKRWSRFWMIHRKGSKTFSSFEKMVEIFGDLPL